DCIEPYPRRRTTGGDSGKLLVSERKSAADKTYLPKLLIKHSFTNDACNEFMASRMASLLGVPAAKVYLVSCPDWEKQGFVTRYICGIEYIEGLRNLTENEKHSIDGGVFLAKAYALAALLRQSDGISAGVSDISDTGKAYYTYDLVETFSLNSFRTDILLGRSLSSKNLESQIFGSIGRTLEGINMENFIIEPLKWNWVAVLKITGENYIEEKWNAFIEPVRRLCYVSDEAVEALVNAVCKFYGSSKKVSRFTLHNLKAADVLRVYYSVYIERIRDLCIELLKDENVDRLYEIKNNVEL
ncbi:MAG: hypothetical protein LIO44_04155, partial [Eubacterium sp.]|nr:hypothetical protein [Eubacterium sp.]